MEFLVNPLSKFFRAFNFPSLVFLLFQDSGISAVFFTWGKRGGFEIGVSTIMETTSFRASGGLDKWRVGNRGVTKYGKPLAAEQVAGWKRGGLEIGVSKSMENHELQSKCRVGVESFGVAGKCGQQGVQETAPPLTGAFGAGQGGRRVFYIDTPAGQGRRRVFFIDDLDVAGNRPELFYG